MRQPRLQSRAQQFGDERARHDDATVDVEPVLAEPGLLGEIRRRQTRADPARNQRLESFAFDRRQPPAERRLQRFVAQLQDVEREEDRLAARVVRSVAEVQACAPHAACGGADEVADSKRGGHLRRSSGQQCAQRIEVDAR
jgi:hypothetical protein